MEEFTPLHTIYTENSSRVKELSQPRQEVVETRDGCKSGFVISKGHTTVSAPLACNDSLEDNEIKIEQNGDGDAVHDGKDETDATSIYSLYMEKDFRYYFQHPYARFFTAYFVVFCNFFIYAEDPVSHSRKECSIPAIGNCVAFVCTRYPPNAWSVLKVMLWIAAIIFGLIAGKLLIHTLVFNRLFRLKMFTSDKGSWMTMFFTTIISLTIFSYLYNGLLLVGGEATAPYSISGLMSIGNDVFMKVAATGTWCGDFFTAWMVTDMMLQEKLYPKWAVGARRWWNRDHHRIILFWIIIVTSSFTVIFIIATDHINWDKLNRDFLHSNELSRAFLASFILVLDVTIVMQDWDFPHFISAIDIKLPGLNTAHIHFRIPRLLRKLEYWHVHITGKWFNYGILLIVIILDLNMWKNQIFYVPFDYGQYVDSEGRVHSVNDAYSLEKFNETLLAFSYRSMTLNPFTNATYIMGDNRMNARYKGYPMGLKALAFVPCVSTFLVFAAMIWIYGRRPKPTKEDPYGGRLKKRKKQRFSLRKGWLSLRKTFRKSKAALGEVEGAADVGGKVEGGSDNVDGEVDSMIGSGEGRKDGKCKKFDKKRDQPESEAVGDVVTTAVDVK